MARHRLEIARQGGLDPYTFDVEGEWTPELELAHKDSVHPAEVVEVRVVWTFEGCRIISATPVESFASLADMLEGVDSDGVRDPGEAIPYAQIKRWNAATEAWVTAWTLGPPNYEQFRVEALRGNTDPDLPDASWNTLANVTLRLSATKRNADTDGVVGLDQQVRISYPDSGRRISWETTVSTKEGVSAVAKAKTFAAIDITLYPMATYVDDTNGPDGIEWVEQDADTSKGRTSLDEYAEDGAAKVPTVVVAKSVIQEWGVTIGASGGNTSPSTVSVETTTRRSADEIEVTRVASADGPNASTFVAQWALAGAAETEEYVSPSGNKARTTWIKRTPANTPDAAPERTRDLKVSITGGYPAQRWRATTGGYDPVYHEGGRPPVEATVDVTVYRTGGTGLLGELPLPGVLGAPWVLDRDASSEGEPEVERGKDAASDKWTRVARLVYRRANLPSKSVLAELSALPTVPSYYLQVT